MSERIRTYLEYINKKIELFSKEPPKKEVLENEINRHLVQVGFFQHERLIHLIVTVIFALLTVGSILFLVADFNISILILAILLFVLLIPYIKHYYLLENSVQHMYKQYDKFIEILDKID